MKKESKNLWQVTQSRSKKKRKVRLALVVLGIIVITLITGNLVRLINRLSEPLSLNYERRINFWDNRFNLNLVYKNEEKVSFIVIMPGEKKVLILEIPANTFMEVPGGFGSWEVRSIFGLGENDAKGAKLLKNSISSFFGLPVDGFVQTRKTQTTNLGNLDSQSWLPLNKNPFSFISWVGRMNTDLTLFEAIRLYILLQQIRFDKIEIIDLQSISVLENATLSDGSEIYLPGARLELFISENLLDPGIKNEQKTIAVLNGTNIPGLAQKYSRLISNLGGNVVISDNTSEKYKHSLVFGEKSLTENRLSQIFNSRYAILDTKPASRAQITVILGEDLTP